MLLTKTVEEKDYDEIISNEVFELRDCYKVLTENGVRIDIGHPHRFWEYGMALKAFYEWDYNSGKNLNGSETNINGSVVDIGSGLSLFGPALSWCENIKVVEIEPDKTCYEHRVICNKVLSENKKPEISWFPITPEQLTAHRKYDAIFCISVIEHVAADHEFLKTIADKVVDGGLLFLTTDIMPREGKGYTFDNLREHNYTMLNICEMIKYLNEVKGFELFGEAELEYKGDKVFNYSFCSIAMVKK